MIKADVLVNNKAWKKYISEPNDYLENKLRKARKTISVFKTKKLNFTLLLSGSNEIKKLNKKFRKKINLLTFYLFLFMKIFFCTN